MQRCFLGIILSSVRVPDVAGEGPQTSVGSSGKRRVSFGVAAPRNRRRRCHVFKQLRGWGEQEEQCKADSSSYPPPLISSLPAGCRYQKGGRLDARRIISCLSKKPQGTWEEAPGEQRLHLHLEIHQPLGRLLQLRAGDINRLPTSCQSCSLRWVKTLRAPFRAGKLLR